MRLKPPTAKRPVRVAELLRESLASILLYKSADPRLHEVTITEVDMSPDLKQAKVFYVIRTGVNADEVAAALDRALGFIKQEVARARILRLMPEFIFLPDDTWERAERLERLLQQTKG
ncbi:MAG: 30S ribosome-binding factor RbfA, partial [Deltaproteobacteria bacterium]|nr:30S ribosome-binding factor RbfA [Deltaproteobacteria bacterium]